MAQTKVIFRPIKPFYINQKFGENKICVSLDGTNKIINCDGLNPPSGYKSLYGPKGHLGIDLRSSRGQEVRAAQRGKVYSIDTNPKSGLDVRIEHEEAGLKFRTIYEHLLGYQSEVGDEVVTGQCIGWADNTGYSSGDHLHFQMEVWNGKKWVPVDPLEYMDEKYAIDVMAINNKLKYAKELVALLMDNLAFKLRK